jgi:hypothetical protein
MPFVRLRDRGQPGLGEGVLDQGQGQGPGGGGQDAQGGRAALLCGFGRTLPGENL